MIVSLNWLKDFVDIKESPNELAELLSLIGLEAELTGFPLEIPGVIIGKVESTKMHPNADKLKLCIVNDGKINHQVICGAPNVQKDQVIAFATVDSLLPGNFRIKKANIRGIESFGMICSEQELNISEEHDGIMVLPDHLELGKSFMSSYGYRFFSLKLDITPNRPDAFSHIGVARDIASKTDRELKNIPTENILAKGTINLDISIENITDCPRYIGCVIKNVAVGPSPEWLVEKLKSVGHRSINNIVDISNYVLIEMGHPTHIFDYDKLTNKSIYVRRSLKKEQIKTLDGQIHKLDETHLLITDGESPIALAGVMGGDDSSVSEKTNTIIVESAYFNPITIRKSSKSLSLSTDASKIYERGADPNGCKSAFLRVVNLIQELTAGKISSEIVDVYPEPIESEIITVRRSELELLSGIKIDDKRIEKILISLEIKIKKIDNGWECSIPTFRPDITREVDIIEEILRIYGYENIPSDEKLYGSFVHKNPDPEKHLESIRNTLSGFGFHQIYANSLQNEEEANLAGESPVKMINPLNQEMGFLRTSLLPGLLKALDHNLKHSMQNIRLFELANIHTSSGVTLDSIFEKKFLSGVLSGYSLEPSVHTAGLIEDLFDLKGYVECLFVEKLGMRLNFIKKEISGFDQAWRLIVNNIKVGSMGKISSNWIEKMNLDISEVFGFEINLGPISHMFSKKKSFKKINSYPTISRDLNLVMRADQETGSIVDVCYKKGKKLMVDVKVVDLFEDENAIGKGMKSVTYSMSFQSPSKTLEDTDVNPIIDEIINIVYKEFDIKLRT